MDSSFQLTIAYDMLHYVKFTALSIKTQVEKYGFARRDLDEPIIPK